MTIYLKLVATMVFWSGTFIAGRWLAWEMPAFSASFLRYLVASVFMLGLTLRVEGRLPRLSLGDLPGVALLGLTGIFGYNYCFLSGLAAVEAGRASLIIAMNPALTALLSGVFLGEGLGAGKLLGVCLSVAGALVVISGGDFSRVAAAGVGNGDLWLVGAVVCWSTYSVLGKLAMRRLSTLAAVTWSCIIGGALLLACALPEGLLGYVTAASPRAWGCVLYLALLGTGLGFSWYYEGIRSIGASRAAVFINLLPVMTILMGAVFLGERVGPSLVAGGVLVVAGVWLTNRAAMRGSGSTAACST